MKRYLKYAISHNSGSSRQSLVGVLVTVFLIAAVFSGVFKNLSSSKTSPDNWDGVSPFSLVINSKPLSVIVFAPEQKKLVLIKLSEDLYLPANKGANPLVVKIGTLIDSADGEKLARVAAVAVRAPVNHFLIKSDNEFANKDLLNKFFEAYASILAPFKIMMNPSFSGKSNISRMNALSLWWQLKSLKSDDLEVADAGSLNEQIVLTSGEKVLGVDDVSVNELSKSYLTNSRILDEGKSVSVVNASGVPLMGQLATDFISALGGRVDSITSDTAVDKCVISGDSHSYTVNYLAKELFCDIKSPKDQVGDKVMVTIGHDFSQRYLF